MLARPDRVDLRDGRSLLFAQCAPDRSLGGHEVGPTRPDRGLCLRRCGRGSGYSRYERGLLPRLGRCRRHVNVSQPCERRSGEDMRPWRRLRFTGRGGKVIRLAGLGVLVASLAVLGVGNASAAVPTRQFTPAPPDSVVKHLPLGLSNTLTTVMVQMTGDPVTVTDADAAAPLTSSQKQTQRD